MQLKAIYKDKVSFFLIITRYPWTAFTCIFGE